MRLSKWAAPNPSSVGRTICSAATVLAMPKAMALLGPCISSNTFSIVGLRFELWVTQLPLPLRVAPRPIIFLEHFEHFRLRRPKMDSHPRKEQPNNSFKNANRLKPP
eukprot:EG_transcript_26186